MSGAEGKHGSPAASSKLGARAAAHTSPARQRAALPPLAEPQMASIVAALAHPSQRSLMLYPLSRYGQPPPRATKPKLPAKLPTSKKALAAAAAGAGMQDVSDAAPTPEVVEGNAVNISSEEKTLVLKELLTRDPALFLGLSPALFHRDMCSALTLSSAVSCQSGTALSSAQRICNGLVLTSHTLLTTKCTTTCSSNWLVAIRRPSHERWPLRTPHRSLPHSHNPRVPQRWMRMTLPPLLPRCT